MKNSWPSIQVLKTCQSGPNWGTTEANCAQFLKPLSSLINNNNNNNNNKETTNHVTVSFSSSSSSSSSSCHYVGVFIVIIAVTFLSFLLSKVLFHLRSVKNSTLFLTGTFMCLNVSEHRVVQALAVCLTLRLLTWHAWIQSVLTPTKGAAEEMETFLEQTSSAAGGRDNPKQI